MVAATPLLERNDASVEAAFAASPPEVVAEILDGELHVQPRPAQPHTHAASFLGGELHQPFNRGRGGPGGWFILDEPELHLGPRPDILVPDLAGWRRERMPDAPKSDAPAFYDLAPDWVCEVISPGTERIDRVKKRRIYRREGVRHLWLLNPVARVLEIFRLEGERWVVADVFEGDAPVRAEPFDAIELELAALWAR
ncbi:MAG TPA: Uma2 family endonuclease [Byssovorax sp.]|jgi:Uma2 family endonuclease